MDEHDYAVYEWFYENITDFTCEFGLMPQLISELGLSGLEKRLFLTKINMIYQSHLKTRKVEDEKENAEY